VPALVDAMLLYILRAGMAERPDGWTRALADPAVGAALHAIHADPGYAWTIARLATRAGLSRSAFAERFAGMVGTAPMTYLTWWRMTRAGRLLREPGASVRTVAERVGYGSEFAFAKAFKREFGVPPGAYRRGTAA
jgi:AraC-like DNA-binding protein